MFDWFKPNSKPNFLETDLHSHLIPGIDDGVKSFDESIAILKEYEALGFKKIITTPHIIHDYYPNTPQIILAGVKELNTRIKKEGIKLTVKAGAEYFIDETFLNIVDKDEQLLTFGDNFILTETGFMTKPIFLRELFFKLISNGLKPILAHPERYAYLQNSYDDIHEFAEMGVKLQVNTMSFAGYYSKEAQKLATYMIKNNLIDFIGSDLHRFKQLKVYNKAIKSKIFQRCRQLQLLNNAL